MRLSRIVVTLLLLVPLVHAGSPPSAPTFPQALTGAGIGEIDLNWSAPTSSGASAVAGYRIYRSLTATGLAHLVDLGNVTAFTDTGILDGAPRYYRLSAVNGDGEGPLSEVVSASAKAPPGVPRGVSAMPGGRGNVSLSWSAPEFNGTADVLAYNVYRSNDSGGPFDFLASEPSRQFLDVGHADNVTWFYRLSAANVYGEGPLSDVIRGNTPRVPDVPTNITASFFPVFGITLDWDAPYDGGNGIVRYMIYRSIGEGAEQFLAAGAPWITSYTDRDCPLLQECHYRIRARNDIGMSDFTPRVTGVGDQPPIID